MNPHKFKFYNGSTNRNEFQEQLTVPNEPSRVKKAKLEVASTYYYKKLEKCYQTVNSRNSTSHTNLRLSGNTYGQFKSISREQLQEGHQFHSDKRKEQNRKREGHTRIQQKSSKSLSTGSDVTNKISQRVCNTV